jgi:hypothetical protein
MQGDQVSLFEKGYKTYNRDHAQQRSADLVDLIGL